MSDVTELRRSHTVLGAEQFDVQSIGNTFGKLSSCQNNEEIIQSQVGSTGNPGVLER